MRPKVLDDSQMRLLRNPSDDESLDNYSVKQRWAEFRQNLPHQNLPYSKRNWGSPAHSICSYQGKLKPALAHHLVRAFSNPGDVVVDPFSGAGTIPFEACQLGRIGIGIDISRLGYVLSRAKCRPPEIGAIESIIVELDHFIRDNEPTPDDYQSAHSVSFNSAIPEYFHADTLREILLSRRFFLGRWGESDAWAYAFACCAHLLHGNRPYALSRNSHPITPFKPTGEAEYRALVPRLRDKAARTAKEWPTSFVAGRAIHGDCIQPWSVESADAIITSPPFFDSTRFYMTNWMRYWFMGWERSDFKNAVTDFLETKQRKSIMVYADFFEQAASALRPGGYAILHLGMSKKCDMAAELAALLPETLDLVDIAYEAVGHCESHGVRDKGTVSSHSYLVLQRT